MSKECKERTDEFVIYFEENKEDILDNLIRVFLAFGYNLPPGVDKEDSRVKAIVKICREHKGRIASGPKMVRNGKIIGEK